MKDEDIAPYQDEDSRMHRAWLQNNASGNSGKGMGSEPTIGIPPIRRAGGKAFGFEQEFFALGHSRGSQSRGNRGIRGNRGNSGNRGRRGRGPSSTTSTGIYASTHREHLPPRSPTWQTLATHSPEGHQLQPFDTNECQGLKRAVDLEGIEEGLTASGSTTKKRRNKAKHDKRNDEA